MANPTSSGDKNPPTMTFGALLHHLKEKSIGATVMMKLLTEHLPSLKNVILQKGSSESIQGASTSTTSEVRFRPGAALTKEYPQPTDAEAARAQTLAKAMHMNVRDVHLLIRDYLIEGRKVPKERTRDILKDADLLSSVVYPDVLLQFRRDETSHAFELVTLVMHAAEPGSGDPLQPSYAAFFNSAEAALHPAIMSAAIASLRTGESVQPQIFEALLAASVLKSFDLVKVQEFLQALLKRRERDGSWILDGSAGSAALVAFFWYSLTCAERDAASNLSASNFLKSCDALFGDVPIEEGCGEVALIRVGLVGITNLAGDQMQWESHLEYAMEWDAFGRIKMLLGFGIFAPRVALESWGVVDRFFKQLPPRNFVQSQIEVTVDLLVNIMSQISDEKRASIIDQFWKDDKHSSGRYSGANLILRMALSLWPDWFEGFVRLLAVLIAPGEPARSAFALLSGGIECVCEGNSYSSDELEIQLEEDNLSVRAHINRDTEWAIMISKVSPEESASAEKSIFVKALCSLRPTSYRPVIPQGTIGYADSCASRILWPVPALGLGAIAHAIHAFTLQRSKELMFSKDLEFEMIRDAAYDALQLITVLLASCDSTARGAIGNHITSDLLVHSLKLLVGLTSPSFVDSASFGGEKQLSFLTAITRCLAYLCEHSTDASLLVLSEISAHMVHTLASMHGVHCFEVIAPLLSIALVPDEIDHRMRELLVTTLLPLWLSAVKSSGGSAKKIALLSGDFLVQSFRLLQRCPDVVTTSQTVCLLMSTIISQLPSTQFDDLTVLSMLSSLSVSLKYLVHSGLDNETVQRSLIVRQLSSPSFIRGLLHLYLQKSEEESTHNDGKRSSKKDISLMSLEILDLLMACLLPDEKGSDVEQLALDDHDGALSRGVAKRIAGGCSRSVRFVTSTILNQQRSLSRRILNPVKESPQKVAQSAVFNAVVENLRGALDDVESEKKVIFVAAGIHFLRVVWESFGSSWLKEAWEQNDLWKLLGFLISCKEGRPSFAAEDDPPGKVTSGLLVFHWRFAVANALALFASEISSLSNECLTRSNGETGSTKETNSKKLSDKENVRKMFESSPFKAFRDSVNENWFCSFIPNTDEMVSIMGVRHDFRSKPNEVEGLSIVERLASELEEKLSVVGDLQRWRNVGLLDYGKSYVYDVEGILRALRTTEGFQGDGCSALQVRDEVAVLNLLMSSVDSQLILLRAFSEASLSAMFADLMAPPYKGLLYSVPYFSGKLCRTLTDALPGVEGHASILLETSRFLAFVSPQISPDELDQPVLSSLRRESPEDSSRAKSPVRNIVESLRDITNILTTSSTKTSEKIFEVTEWLLLSAAQLAVGVSFATKADVRDLVDIAKTVLSLAYNRSRIIIAACLVLSKVACTEEAVEGIGSALLHLNSGVSSGHDELSSKLGASETLVFAASCLDENILRERRALRWLSGTVGSFLTVEACHGYDITTSERHDAHRLLCASLGLAARLVGSFEGMCTSGELNSYARDILEYVTCNARVISQISLDLTGDWPPKGSGDVLDQNSGSKFSETVRKSRFLTLARIEEAELASQVIFSLAGFTSLLRDELPGILEETVHAVRTYVHCAYRLIRAEPLERWVRPLSKTECRRSAVYQGGNQTKAGSVGSPVVSSPWALTPPGTPVANSISPRRSPLVAIYASMSGSKSSRGGIVPPSPRMPNTPLQTPSMGPSLSSNRAATTPSPLAGSCSTALITSYDLTFGEEASRSILRGLVAALGALRRFGDVLGEPIFFPSMHLSEKSPSIGLLVALQYHACAEVYQRKAEGERRDNLLMIIDNAMHITIAHLVLFISMDALPRSTRDEVKKRLSVILSRLRRAVPPPPSHSVVHSREIDEFLDQLDGK